MMIKDLAALVQLVISLRTSSKPWPVRWAWYESRVSCICAGNAGAARRGSPTWTQLQQLAKGYASCEHFLTELGLDRPDATDGPASGEDYVVLSTIHSAKGREWSIVPVLSVVDGVLPSKLATSVEQIEEERRLL
jgi:DNA helicase-2/ATP-dependent DNA helicase PcrA